jgi:hypothetical protein
MVEITVWNEFDYYIINMWRFYRNKRGLISQEPVYNIHTGPLQDPMVFRSLYQAKEKVQELLNYYNPSTLRSGYFELYCLWK